VLKIDLKSQQKEKVCHSIASDMLICVDNDLFSGAVNVIGSENYDKKLIKFTPNARTSKFVFFCFGMPLTLPSILLLLLLVQTYRFNIKFKYILQLFSFRTAQQQQTPRFPFTNPFRILKTFSQQQFCREANILPIKQLLKNFTRYFFQFQSISLACVCVFVGGVRTESTPEGVLNIQPPNYIHRFTICFCYVYFHTASFRFLLEFFFRRLLLFVVVVCLEASIVML